MGLEGEKLAILAVVVEEEELLLLLKLWGERLLILSTMILSTLL